MKKWDRRRREDVFCGLVITSRTYVLLFLHARAHAHEERTRPDVSQLCSTTKQYLIQSNCKNLPVPSPPFLPPSHYPFCSPFTPTKKLLIARQRSIIKTYVYTRVSFMDRGLEGGGGGWTHECSVNHVEQRATVICFLSPFSGIEPCSRLEARNVQQCCYSACYLSFSQRKVWDSKTFWI